MISLPLLAASALMTGAAASDSSLLKSRPARALVDELIELAPVDGHHFNVEAPQRCGDKRAEVTPRRFRCQPRRGGPLEVVASVCDDAKTFCRQERFTVAVAGAAAQAAREKSVARPHAAPPGFLVNEPGKAVTLARREHRPLFVHFYGIWCPPCNMLEEQVYPTEAFQKASDGFVKLALDADAELSWDWKARFKIGGYPTLLALDERGRELGRVVGFEPAERLAAFLKSAEAETEPVEAAAAALAGKAPSEEPARRARVARWRYERAETAEAVEAAGAAPEARRWSLLARRDRAEKEGDEAALAAAAKELVAALPDDPEYVSWAGDLAERDKAAGAALEPAVKASVLRWTADAAGLGAAGLVPGDVRESEAAYWEALGRSDEAKAAWSAGADAYAAQAKDSTLPLARGANLERAICLGRGGRAAEARALFESLVGAYPDEFTFHYYYGRTLLELGEAAPALAHARDAARLGYGDNWLRAVALEGKALKALGLPAEAAKAIDAALAEAAAPRSTAVRTHRYLADLRRLRAEL